MKLGLLSALRSMTQEVISDDEMDHGFDHRDGSWEHAGVVTTASSERGFLFVVGHGLLLAQDCGGRLKGDAEDDVFTVANAALDAATAVGAGADAIASHVELVIVLQAGHERAGEAAADLETLRRRQAEHGFCQIGLQFVKNRLAETRRHATDDTFDHASDAVSLTADFFDEFDHALGGLGIACADDVGLDVLGGELLRYFGLDVLDRLHVGQAFVGR